MKKLLLALLAGLTIMSTAAVASAEITVGGQIETRYDLWNTLNLNRRFNDVAGSHGSNTQTFWGERVTLNVDAKITEGLEAFVELDTTGTECIWGGAAAGVGAPAVPGAGYLNHQDGTLSIKQSWINFMVPGAPVGIKIGHQPLALGHGIFLDTHRQGSDAILLYSKPIPELLLAGVYIKGFENSNSAPGVTANNISGKNNTRNLDADFYAALANYTWMENNTVGMNFTYVHDNSTFAAINRPVWATNTMLTMDGAIAGINYRSELDWLYVNVNDIFATGKDYSESGWAAMLGADYKVMDMLTVGMEVAYGSGNDNNRVSVLYNPVGNIGTGPANTKAGEHIKIHDTAYATPYNATSYNYAFLYNDKIGQGPFGTGGGFGFGDGFGGFGLANTGYAKLSMKAKPMDRLTAGMDVLYLRASEQNVVGQSRDLGWEIDANVGYKIYDNLNLDILGGVFMPGAWYAYGSTVSGPLNGGTTIDQTDANNHFRRDTAFGMETKLTVKF